MKPGNVLPNGAVIIAICIVNDHGVVMGKHNNGDYATWRFYNNDLASTSIGVYFGDEKLAAFKNFKLRVLDTYFS